MKRASGMQRTVNFLGWAMLLSLALGVVLLVAAVSAIGSMDHAVLRIGGEPVLVDQLDAGESLLAVGAVALALLIAAVVVPLAVLMPLAIVVLVLVGVLLVLAGVFAMLCSPLLLAGLVVWLMVRLIRRGQTKTDAAGGATIVG